MRATPETESNPDCRDQILAYLRDSGLNKDARLPSIRQIARRMNTSKAVAERAVRSLVGEGFCYAQQGRGVFLAVNNAELRATATIAAIFGGLEYPRATNFFYRQLYEGTQEWTSQQGHNMLKFFQWRKKSAGLKAREWSQFSDRVAGVFVIGIYEDPDLILLRNSGLPLVVMDYDTRSLGIDCVVMDNRECMRQLAAAVLKKGADCVFLVLGARATDADPAPAERREGLERAMAEHGCARSQARVVALNGTDDTSAALAAEIAAAAKQLQHPPAILAEDGGLLVSLTRALATHGLACGHDYFAGYVGSDAAAELAAIPALVASYDFQELGRAAAKLLDERVNGCADRARRIVISPTMREARTCDNGLMLSSQ